MTLQKISELLNAEIVWADQSHTIDIQVAKASDLMSDVLRFSGPGKLLITGLTNTHTVRTCDIAGIKAIVFARGKKPTPEVIELGKEAAIALLTTDLSMFETCGILYAHGVRGVQINQKPA
ncbi:MAG: hypothetical protein JSW02_06490 [candidate division WOR-3 bacterium]|nr:MAG: hypothetical protein JSW02_06490 [candidate division WOR-3 bacterium]